MELWPFATSWMLLVGEGIPPSAASPPADQVGLNLPKVTDWLYSPQLPGLGSRQGARPTKIKEGWSKGAGIQRNRPCCKGMLLLFLCLGSFSLQKAKC